MFRISALILFSLIAQVSLCAQPFRPYSEFGPVGGVSYYMGDLNPGRQFFMPRGGAGLVFRHSHSPRWTWRVHALYMGIQADDALSDIPAQIQRNLSFRSVVLEFSPILEFNFFPYEVGNSETPATPYVFGGLALFRFNPQAELNGEWIPLQPLGTEGQGASAYPDRKPYSLINATFPFGFGFKFHAFGRLGVSLEWGLRRTSTDYLDDVSTTYADRDILFATHGVQSALLADRSLINPGDINTGRQRGNPSNNDWYGFAGLTLSYKLMKRKPECAAYQ